MSYYDQYKSKLRTPEEAVKAVKSGDWVEYTTSNGFPALLDEALAARKDELSDVKIRGNLIFGPIKVVECDPQREHFHIQQLALLCIRAQTLRQRPVQLYTDDFPKCRRILQEFP